MIPLFGLAGPAEAVEGLALTSGYGGLLLLGILAAVGFFGRFRVAATLAVLSALLLTLVFTPWEAFRSFESDDPDVHHWVAAWRGFALWWIAGMGATMAAAFRAFLSGKSGSSQSDGQVAGRGAAEEAPGVGGPGG
jgi:hypothetical protein